MIEPSDKAKSSSKLSWISGARHVIVSRRALVQSLVIVVGLVAGAFAAERIRLHHNSAKLRDHRAKMKGTNLRLKAEKNDYKTLFKQMSDQLESWKSTPGVKKLSSFKEMSEELMVGLDDVRTVLEEKEFQLWEKEGLLEYQEERLLDSEDQEVQMALYINMLAKLSLDHNISLPAGLEEQPYYGSRDEFTPQDDETSPEGAAAAEGPAE